MPPELLDEVEALYAPPGHSVFELVPPAFNEQVTEHYSAIGQPVVNVDTFWDIYCQLLEMLREQSGEQLTDILATHQMTLEQDINDCMMPLLPNMEPFRLGQPLEIGGRSNYVGGLGSSELADMHDLIPEYADFTDSGDDDDEGSNDNSE